MNRHQLRERIVFALYQHLLLKKDLKECMDSEFEGIEKDEYVQKVEDYLLENETAYIVEIGSHLKEWAFDRLNYVDQAILLEATAEVKEKINDKPVVIDEAVRLCKTYSDETSYKYVNAALDNL